MVRSPEVRPRAFRDSTSQRRSPVQSAACTATLRVSVARLARSITNRYFTSLLHHPLVGLVDLLDRDDLRRRRRCRACRSGRASPASPRCRRSATRQASCSPRSARSPRAACGSGGTPTMTIVPPGRASRGTPSTSWGALMVSRMKSNRPACAFSASGSVLRTKPLAPSRSASFCFDGGGAEQRHLGAHRPRELDPHVAEARRGRRSPTRWPGLHAPLPQRRVGGDPGTEQRRGTGRVETGGDPEDEALLDHDAASNTRRGSASSGPSPCRCR